LANDNERADVDPCIPKEQNNQSGKREEDNKEISVHSPCRKSEGKNTDGIQNSGGARPPKQN
jgi:hypothetical protein